jgi:hypothetical protein
MLLLSLFVVFNYMIRLYNQDVSVKVAPTTSESATVSVTE